MNAGKMARSSRFAGAEPSHRIVQPDADPHSASAPTTTDANANPMDHARAFAVQANAAVQASARARMPTPTTTIVRAKNELADPKIANPNIV